MEATTKILGDTLWRIMSFILLAHGIIKGATSIYKGQRLLTLIIFSARGFPIKHCPNIFFILAVNNLSFARVKSSHPETSLERCRGVLLRIHGQKPYPNNTDTEGTIESVRTKRVEFRENARVFFPQGQSKLSVIMRYPY